MPLFANEKVCVKELNDNADKLIRQYSLGRLLVKGDNRFLSDDILDLLIFLIDNGAKRNHKERTFWSVAMTERFNKNSFYSPGASYDADAVCTLLRNPHIARNEEIQLKLYGKSTVISAKSGCQRSSTPSLSATPRATVYHAIPSMKI